MEDGASLPVLVENRTGYKNLCELLSQAHLRSEKGKCAVKWSELPEFARGLIALLGSARALACTTWRRSPNSTSVLVRQGPRKQHRRGRVRSPECRRMCALCDRHAFGRENVFVEIQRHFIRGEERINRQLARSCPREWIIDARD